MSNNSAKHAKGNDVRNSILNSSEKGNNKEVKNKRSKKNLKNSTYNENGKDKKGKKGHLFLKIFLPILLIIAIVAGIVLGKYMHKSGGSFTGAIMNMVKDVLGDQDPIFILVMGVSEDISVELTDTIILMGYNPDTNQAFMLSIPRDTFVGKNEAYAGGYDKINALYQTNPEKTVDAVERLTGVQIDYYVTVKTGALVEIVDIIGGVDFDVPINMDYDDDSQDLHIHLKAGQQRLNGDQAEQLVRFRHNNNGSSYSSEYGDNDIGRMRTQREFIKVVASDLIKTNDMDKLKEIAKAIFSNLSTNMDIGKAISYIPYAVNFDVENNLAMEQLPGTPAMINELWFYRANTSQTREIIDSFVEKLGLTEEEKAKYIKPITQTSSGGGSSSKKNDDSSSSNTSTQNTNTTVNNTIVNNTVNNTVQKNTVENNTVNSVEVSNTVNNTTNDSENGTGNSGSSEANNTDNGSGNENNNSGNQSQEGGNQGGTGEGGSENGGSNQGESGSNNQGGAEQGGSGSGNSGEQNSGSGSSNSGSEQQSGGEQAGGE